MGGSNKTQTSTTTSGPPQQVQDAYKSLMQQAKGVASTAYDPNTNKQVAGFTDPQYQSFQGVANAQGSWKPYVDSAGSATAAGVAPISTQSILDNYSPYIQAQTDALQANLAQQNAQTLQQVNSNAAKIGALTGDRSQIAAQQATNDNNRNAATAMAGLQSQAFGQAADISQNNAARSLQGANIYGNLGAQTQQAGYTDANALWGIGAAQQGQQQAVYDANSANAAAAAQYPFQTLSWLSNIYGSALPGFGTTTTQETPGPNPWSQALGLGLGAASLFSDARVKEGIAPVGQMFDGTTIYKFNYKGSPATQIGVMAQDIERRMPEAVSEGVGGIKSVNYDMVTEPSAQIASGASEGIGGLGALLKGVAHARDAFAAGGSVYSGARSYVPQVDLAPARVGYSSAPGPTNSGGQSGGVADILSSMKAGREAGKGLGNVGSMLRTSTDPASGWSTTVNPSGAQGWGNYLSNAVGLGGMFYRGGAVQRYEDGGFVDGADPYGEEEDVAGALSGDGAPALWGVSGQPGYAYEPAAPANAGSMMGAAPTTAPATMRTAPEASEPGTGLFGLFPGSEEARVATLAAGLGMLASNSPFVGTAVGEGGLAGVKYYDAAKTQRRRDEQLRTSAEAGARRLQEAAERARQAHSLNASRLDETIRHNQAMENRFGPGGTGSSMRERIISELMERNPGLSYEAALSLSQRGPEDDTLRRERLALDAYNKGAFDDLDGARKAYGLNPVKAPAQSWPQKSESYGPPVPHALGDPAPGASSLPALGRAAPAAAMPRAPAADPQAVLNSARSAIAAGKDPNAVKQRLIDMGIDPTGL